ncbi:UNKNOWN [Stylonychia lemnae]|uniref:Uncharacterized protein n=1 Tax=Stylonychia lemnae TaxID=5949 RepID=A0A078AQA7_STYLE|nr:UNKNOWN [Stylonychia lemnae]|eukprot:CDW84590.1 UNKNOWN [Stylonychia lemnae]
MHRILFAASALLTACRAIQISHALEKQRGQLGWRQEATNKFTWNSTQQLHWTVVNAFVDVQTSPDGDVYAIQQIGSPPEKLKYSVYLYDISSNVWTLTDPTFEAKAVRFDRLGNIYYLTPDNCVLNSEKVELVCGLSDFEVTVKNEIIGLRDDSGTLTPDRLSDGYHQIVGNPKYSYKALTGYKGLTLIKDEPIFISEDGTVDARYGGEKLASISAGIDGSLWALQLNSESQADHELLKWQTVAQKWYKVGGAVGTCISAYNEISVAVVDSRGLLSLSSQTNQQSEVLYTQGSAAPEPESFPESSLLNSTDFEWLQTALSFVEFTGFEKCYDTQTPTIQVEEGCGTMDNLIFVQKAKLEDGSYGRIAIYVKDGQQLLSNVNQTAGSGAFSTDASNKEKSAIIGFHTQKVMEEDIGSQPYYGDRDPVNPKSGRLLVVYKDSATGSKQTFAFTPNDLPNSLIQIDGTGGNSLKQQLQALLAYQIPDRKFESFVPFSDEMEVFSGKVIE